MPHVTIVGGGIAGLATAWYLQKEAAARQLELTWTLIEADDRLGGKILTAHPDNLLIEGGPDSFVVQKPEGAQLCRELGLGDRLIGLNHNPVYVLHRRRLRRIPPGFYLTVPANLVAFAKSPLFSLRGKLRMALEPFIPPRRDESDESLADFVRRRVGSEVLERVAGPMMAGIFVADPEKLSMKGAFPRFLDLEKQYGSLIRAIRAGRKQRQAAAGKPKGPKPAPPSPFLTLKGGLGELVEALEAKLTGDIRLGARVAELRPRQDGVDVVLDGDGEILRSDAVVLAIPAYDAAPLVEPFLPELTRLLAAIRYLSTATVSLAFRRADLADAHHTDGLGFIVANKQEHRVMACTFTSNKFDGRAPDDQLLLRFFVGGYAQESLVGLDDGELLRVVREELRDIIGIRAEPIVQKIFRWPNGNPQYDVGHIDRVEAMEALADTVPGLYLTGSAYRGVGIPGCVANAQRTVAQVMARLTGTPS